jgi:hypothetical protein
MKILVACEESQAVTKELRRLGHEDYSCDIVNQTGGHPEWHIKQDVLPLLSPEVHTLHDCQYNGFHFQTMDGIKHRVRGKWDMIIAFPPCTHLAVSGAKHFEKKRADGRQREGIELFCAFFGADCDRVAIENPVNIISGAYVAEWFPDLSEKYGLPRKATQTIQPYQFGNPFKKTTNLWLKGLPPLVSTDVVEPELVSYTCKNGKVATFSADYGGGGKGHGTRRSKTYPGVATAMAEQWAGPAPGYEYVYEEDDSWML